MPDLKEILRPVIVDAAESINYATGYPVERVREWLEQAPEEELQGLIMGAVQDAIATALGINPEIDYTAPEPPVIVADYIPTDPEHPGYRP